MNSMKIKKKLLILGGKPIGSCEIVKAAKEKGIYTIVADFLDDENSIAKQIADESWLISTADLDALEKKSRENSIDAVLSGVHEFNIEKMIELCERLHLPCYATLEQWSFCQDKAKFKDLCRKNNILVSPEYVLDKISDIKEFPVIVKPVDSSGSRGFSICNNQEEISIAYKKAMEFSKSKRALIEKYMSNDTVIIHYTIIDGNIIFSGMSEKKSMKLMEYGSSVMALQIFPSKSIENYINTVNEKAIQMFSSIDMKNGVIWIEAFREDDKFVFNEMGYRFGGSLTYYPVKYFYDIDQVDLMIEYAIYGKNNVRLNDLSELNYNKEKKYSIFPLHVNPGQIKIIDGIEKIINIEGLYAYVPVHHVGDIIDKWGTAQQVFCYLHVVFENVTELRKIIHEVLDTLKIYDENNTNLLFSLFDIDSLTEI